MHEVGDQPFKKMHKVIQICLLLIFGGVFHAFANGTDNYLLWMIEEGTTVKEIDGSSVLIQDLMGRGAADGYSVDAVRVKIMYDGKTEYLTLGYSEGDGYYDPQDLPSTKEIGGKDVDSWEIGPVYADFSDKLTSGLDDASVSFMIELGSYTSDNRWIVLAASESTTLEDLRKNSHVFASELDPQSDLAWKPTFAVPEPTSGLLLLIGAGLLTLRRRRS